MSRLSGSNSAEVEKRHIEFAALVDFDFPSGHVYLNSRDCPLTFNGHVYQGFGQFGSMSDVSETADGSPDKIDFVLSAAPVSVMSSALSENYHGRSVTVHIGYLNPDNSFVDTPFLLWDGYMDTMNISADEGVLSITLTAENHLIKWNQSSGWLYTQEHQNTLVKTGYATSTDTDNIFDQLSSTVDKVLKWYDNKYGAGFRRYLQ